MGPSRGLRGASLSLLHNSPSVFPSRFSRGGRVSHSSDGAWESVHPSSPAEWRVSTCGVPPTNPHHLSSLRLGMDPAHARSHTHPRTQQQGTSAAQMCDQNIPTHTLTRALKAFCKFSPSKYFCNLEEWYLSGLLDGVGKQNCLGQNTLKPSEASGRNGVEQWASKGLHLELLVFAHPSGILQAKIGRASCRERV